MPKSWLTLPSAISRMIPTLLSNLDVEGTRVGRRLLATVFELVDEIEAEFAAAVGGREFDALRDMLLRLATSVDPIGAFGASDEATKRKARAGAR
jgi:hypothetical protein